MPDITCAYCDEVMPQSRLNNHMRVKHSPPTAQELANYYRKFSPQPQQAPRPQQTQQRSQPQQTASAARHPAGSPSSGKTRTGNNPPASTAFTRWHDDHASTASFYTGSITAEQISSFLVDRSDRPSSTAESIQKSAKYDIQELVREFKGLGSEEKDECYGLVRGLPVFACLSVYIFTHLKVCVPENTSLLDSFRSKTDEWIREGDEWCLLNYDTIKNDLTKFVEESQVEDHRCNQKLLNGTSVHPFDIRNLAALVIIFSSDQSRAGSFYSMKDDQAQSMTDLLQALIDVKDSTFDSWYQRRFLDAVIRLSRRSRKHPRSLKITGVQEACSTNHRGGFGAIFLGKLSGKVVALKQLQTLNRTTPQFLKDFCQEAVVWRNVHHINCLPFYGVTDVTVDEATRTCLVSPWMENGNLTDYLNNNQSIPRLPLLLDIANGLLYLHTMQPTIVHGDLKCLNIFVTGSGRACLADFGLATAHNGQDYGATTTLNVHGTAGYMAPELIKASKHPDLLEKLDLRRCDMFAFGCIIYEVYTSRPPFQGSSPVRNAALEVGIRPTFPNEEQYKKLGLDGDMWAFIENLWAHRPESRLVAQSARDFLRYKASTAGQSVSRPVDEDSEWDTMFLSSLVVASDPFAL